MKTVYVLSALLVSMTLLFQNCARQFRSSALEAGSNVISFSSRGVGADLSWIVSEDVSLMKLNEYGRIERWYDVTGKLIPLYPPLISGSQTLDSDHSGLLKDTINGKRLNFGNKSYLTPVSQDTSVFLADEYTVLIEFSNIELPNADPKVVRTFGLMPLNGEEAGILVLDVSDNGDKVNFTANQWFNSTSYSSNMISIPKADLKKGFGVAVRFGKAADSLNLAINGELSTTKATIVGTIPNLGFVTRTFELHSSNWGSGGSFDFAEVGIFKKALTDSELMEYSLGLYRTHELHESTTIGGGPDIGGTTDLTFDSIKSIFQKSIGSGTCLGCHSEVVSQSAIVAASSGNGKWIVSGNAASSVLIKAVRHQTGVQAMPKGSGQMDEADIKKLEDWINQGAK